MLLELDDGTNDVFYVAPRFYRLDEINSAWQRTTVATQSIFVSPQSIGELDDNIHVVSYDEYRTFVCSEPRELEALAATDLAERLRRRLQQEKRPLRELIPDAVERAANAEQRAIRRVVERRTRERAQTLRQEAQVWGRVPERELPSPAGLQRLVEREILAELPLRPRPTRAPLPIAEPREPRSLEEAGLRKLSDLAAAHFHAQLVIVQARNT